MCTLCLRCMRAACGVRSGPPAGATPPSLALPPWRPAHAACGAAPADMLERRLASLTGGSWASGGLGRFAQVRHQFVRVMSHSTV